jgi:hypothetical protein
LFPRLAAYLLAVFLRSHRYFPPLLVFLIGLMLLYAARPNPVMGSYAASSVLVYFVSAWFGAGFCGAIGEAQEHIAAVHAGSVRKYLAGKTMAVITCGWLISLAAVVYPVAAGSFDEPVRAGDWLTALLAHVELSLLGGLAALLLSQPIIRKGSLAAASLLLVLMLSVVRNAVLSEIGGGFELLFVLLPPAAPLVDRLINPDAVLNMRNAAVWVWPVVYGGALYGLYLTMAERKM